MSSHPDAMQALQEYISDVLVHLSDPSGVQEAAEALECMINVTNILIEGCGLEILESDPHTGKIIASLNLGLGID